MRRLRRESPLAPTEELKERARSIVQEASEEGVSTRTKREAE